MLDLQAAILEQIKASAPKSVSVGDLYFGNTAIWQSLFQQHLIQLWKDGKVFVSRVERVSSGYLPDTEASWTTTKEAGYYGYDFQWGLYQISEKPLESLTISLEATINVGFQVHRIAVSNNGEDFIIGGKSEKILLGDLNRVEITKEFAANSNVWSLCFSPIDGQYFVSGHNDGSILLWSKYKEEHHLVAETGDRVTGLQYSPEGKSLISSHQLRNSRNYPVRLTQIENQDSISGIGHHSKNVYCVSFFHNSESIVSAGSEQVLKHYSVKEQRELFTSKKQSGTITCLVVHPYLPLVVTGSWSGKYNVYNLTTQEELYKVEAHSSRLTTLAISPSGQFLATGSLDSHIAVWKLPEFTLLKRFVAHNGWIRSLSFADNTTILSGGTDELFKIWRLNYIETSPFNKDEIIKAFQRKAEDEDNDE